MTILNGLSISTLAMRSQATALNVIGTNVSNVQTGGFKRADAQFETLLSDPLFEQSDINGTRPKILQRNTIQGNLLPTGGLLDLAIIGDGFFVTRSTFDASGETLYSRDGNFATRVLNEITVTDSQTGDTFQSNDSYIVDKNGNYVLGFPAAADGTFPSGGTPAPMRVDRNAFLDQGTSTTTAELILNLDSNAETVSSHLLAVSNLDSNSVRADGMEVFSISYVDTNGTRQTARLNFTKDDTNEWDVSATYDGAGSAQIEEIELLGDVIDVGDSYTSTVNGTSVTYTAVSGDTITEVVAGLVSALNANATIAADVTAAAGTTTGTITLTGTAVGTTFTSTASGSNGSSLAQVETVTLTGAVETGERFEVIINGTTVSYIVTAADTTLTQVAAGLFANINLNGTVNTVVTAAAGATAGTITLTGDTVGSSFSTTSAVAQADTVTIGGTVDAGDVYSVTVDGNVVSYTVTGGEANLTAVRTNLVNAINADATVGAIVTATAGAASGEVIIVADTAGNSFTASTLATDGGAFPDNTATIVSTTGGSVSNTTTTAAQSATNDNSATSNTIFSAQSVLTTTPVTRLTFDGDGEINSPTSITFDFSIPASGSEPAATASFDLDISDMHQFATSFLFQRYSENGFEESSLNEITFDSLGRVVGYFDNGRTRELYQVPLAKFSNPDALETRNGQLFAETTNSGTPVVETIDVSEIASFAVGIQEISNVNLVDEFSALIRTQQAYNSSANAFRTVDEMYQIVAQMKR